MYDYEAPNALDLPWTAPGDGPDPGSMVTPAPALARRRWSANHGDLQLERSPKPRDPLVPSQTLQDLEILVVGDACTDDSEAVAAFGEPVSAG